MKRFLSIITAVVLSGSVAIAANLPLQTGPQDPSEFLARINQLIQSINSGVGGLINAQTGATATAANTTETTLQTYTLPANTLSATGQSIRVSCWGTTGATANNKTMKLYFGNSVITTPTAATNAKGWKLELIVTRTGASTQAVVGTGVVDTTPVAVYQAAGTDALTSNQIVKCTGTNGTAAAADITANAQVTELIK